MRIERCGVCQKVRIALNHHWGEWYDPNYILRNTPRTGYTEVTCPRCLAQQDIQKDDLTRLRQNQTS